MDARADSGAVVVRAVTAATVLPVMLRFSDQIRLNPARQNASSTPRISSTVRSGWRMSLIALRRLSAGRNSLATTAVSGSAPAGRSSSTRRSTRPRRSAATRRGGSAASPLSASSRFASPSRRKALVAHSGQPARARFRPINVRTACSGIAAWTRRAIFRNGSGSGALAVQSARQHSTPGSVRTRTGGASEISSRTSIGVPYGARTGPASRGGRGTGALPGIGMVPGARRLVAPRHLTGPSGRNMGLDPPGRRHLSCQGRPTGMMIMSRCENPSLSCRGRRQLSKS